MSEYTGNLNLNLSGKISYKDYRNMSLELFLRRYWYIIVIFILVFLAVEDINLKILSVAALVIVPFSRIRSVKKTYRQNKSFHEKLTYHLDNEKITITGETVSSTQNWSRLFKITETRNAFVLYYDSINASFLDKKMFSAEEIIEFRKFLNSLDVKKKLKNK